MTAQRDQFSAFRDMIAMSELGPEIIAGSDRGYNVLVGSTPSHIVTFPSYTDHPRQLVRLSATLESTAAGRYQIRAPIFDAYKSLLGLHDFEPEAQEAIAMQLIRECHALDDISNGHVTDAIFKCRSRWASLPGADYGQHEHPIALLASYFRNAGGIVMA